MIRISAQFHSKPIFAGIMLALTLVSLPVRAQNTRCHFVDSLLTFSGSPREQAQCLLRPVKMYGQLGATLSALPMPLDTLIGRAVALDRATIKRYLSANNIREDEIGGSLADPLSRANNNDPNSPIARYFVIHDVSTPNYLNTPFPANINEAAWRWNDLNKWRQDSRAHIYVNRVGKSTTAWDFKTAGRATKFETKVLKLRGKGLFLHVELVQPRRRDPNGGAQNDAIAPTPGFTEAQLQRLALLYVAASVRAGQWLIPAFHAALDVGIPDAHDDPQNFDLNQWAQQLKTLLEAIAAVNR